MDSKNRPTERGQALVLIVLALVVLLGFTALAIDGSVVYSDRRYAQNAADAASLAGGGEAALYLENNGIRASNFSCPPEDISEDPAVIRAGSNDIAIDKDISDDNGVEAVCDFETIGNYQRDFLDVKVLITSDSQPVFAQFVYQGQLVNTVEAVTRVYPRSGLAFGMNNSTRISLGFNSSRYYVGLSYVHFTMNNRVGTSGNWMAYSTGNIRLNVVRRFRLNKSLKFLRPDLWTF